jgi:oxygen-dependent protoporphyrinogen oxidase
VGEPFVDAIVVGAGVAGLAAALELQSGGCEVLVVDPSDRPGGVMRTDHVSGYVIERGPNTTQVKAPMLALLRRYGLQDVLVRAEPESRRRFLYRGGELVPVPLSPLDFLRTPLLSRRAKLRMLAEPLRRRGSADGESVAEFASRRLGAEAVSALVGPFLTGVYAGDERELGASAVFGELVAFERRHGSIAMGALWSGLARGRPRGLSGTWSTSEGLGPFARRLADRLREPPALGSRVTGLARDGRRWRVEMSGPMGDSSVSAQRVVLATPSLEAATLLRGVNGDAAAALERVVYAPIVGIPVGVHPRTASRGVEGFGFLVPRDEDLNLLGCLYMSRLFPGRAPEGRELLHCMLGGTRWPDAIHEPDDLLVKRVVDDLERGLGLTSEPAALAITRWPRAIPQPDRDHVSRIGWVRKVLRETPGLALAGSYLAGVSVADSLASGVAAATELL